MTSSATASVVHQRAAPAGRGAGVASNAIRSAAETGRSNTTAEASRRGSSARHAWARCRSASVGHQRGQDHEAVEERALPAERDEAHERAPARTPRRSPTSTWSGVRPSAGPRARAAGCRAGSSRLRKLERASVSSSRRVARALLLLGEARLEREQLVAAGLDGALRVLQALAARARMRSTTGSGATACARGLVGDLPHRALLREILERGLERGEALGQRRARRGDLLARVAPRRAARRRARPASSASLASDLARFARSCEAARPAPASSASMLRDLRRRRGELVETPRHALRLVRPARRPAASGDRLGGRRLRRGRRHRPLCGSSARAAPAAEERRREARRAKGAQRQTPWKPLT